MNPYTIIMRVMVILEPLLDGTITPDETAEALHKINSLVLELVDLPNEVAVRAVIKNAIEALHEGGLLGESKSK